MGHINVECPKSENLRSSFPRLAFKWPPCMRFGSRPRSAGIDWQLEIWSAFFGRGQSHSTEDNCALQRVQKMMKAHVQNFARMSKICGNKYEHVTWCANNFMKQSRVLGQQHLWVREKKPCHWMPHILLARLLAVFARIGWGFETHAAHCRCISFSEDVLG